MARLWLVYVVAWLAAFYLFLNSGSLGASAGMKCGNGVVCPVDFSFHGCAGNNVALYFAHYSCTLGNCVEQLEAKITDRCKDGSVCIPGEESCYPSVAPASAKDCKTADDCGPPAGGGLFCEGNRVLQNSSRYSCKDGKCRGDFEALLLGECSGDEYCRRGMCLKRPFNEEDAYIE